MQQVREGLSSPAAAGAHCRGQCERSESQLGLGAVRAEPVPPPIAGLSNSLTDEQRRDPTRGRRGTPEARAADRQPLRRTNGPINIYDNCSLPIDYRPLIECFM